MKKLFTILAAAICINANAQVCFSTTNYPAGNAPYSVCSADFNNDGFKDLAVTSASPYSTTHGISILLSTGTGTFGTATNFTAGTQPYEFNIITADFNGDGKADLATANNNTNDVSILLGTGTGGFGASTNFAVGTGPYSLVSADFNGDGNADLATGNQSSNNVSILLGTGTGSFGIAANFVVGSATYYPQSVISADFNGDAKFDLAVTSQGSDSVSILLGSGTGVFGVPISNIISGGGAISIISADFNNDGKADLANANYSNVSIFLGNGMGNFSAANNVVTGIYSQWSVTSADFNNDGNADLAAANDTLRKVSVFLGNGTGNFGIAANFTVSGSGPLSITNADFNGDGKADLATTNYYSNDISVLLNSPPHTVSVTASATTICPGNSSILTASGSTTYSWSTGASTATISVAPTTTTTYSVTDGSCSNTAVTIINVAVPTTPNICMVTTDSVSNYNYNIIYWDKTLYTHVDSFIVYRYDVMSSSYLRIGAVSKNSLSEFKDSLFNIGGPNGGNPLYSSWQYKLAIKDTCGNIGAKSPYHQSTFVQESGATFSWNAYTVEGGSSPVTGYSFLRDDNNTGSWHVLVNTAGLSSTDPGYFGYPNGNWRVDALGFNCTPTLRLAGNNNTLNTSKKSHSNTSKPTAVGINQISNNNNQISIFPNPSNNHITIQSSIELGVITIYNSLGEKVKEVRTKMQEARVEVDISNLPVGIYTVQTQGRYIKMVKE